MGILSYTFYWVDSFRVRTSEGEVDVENGGEVTVNVSVGESVRMVAMRNGKEVPSQAEFLVDVPKRRVSDTYTCPFFESLKSTDGGQVDLYITAPDEYDSFKNTAIHIKQK